MKTETLNRLVFHRVPIFFTHVTLAATIALAVFSASSAGETIPFPSETGEWIVGDESVGRVPTEEITVSIRGIGAYRAHPVDLKPS